MNSFEEEEEFFKKRNLEDNPEILNLILSFDSHFVEDNSSSNSSFSQNHSYLHSENTEHSGLNTTVEGELD